MCDCDIEKLLSERDALMIREYNAALDLASFDPQDTVLDVATGSGRMLLQTLKRGHSVVSGDIDEEALDRARKRLGNLADRPRLLIMDAHKLELADNSFHAVTFANAVHEIDDPRRALDEMLRVLTRDGKLLIIEFNSRGYEMVAMHHRLQGNPEHRRGEMSTDEIDSYLRSSFDRVERRDFSVTHAWVASGKEQR